MHTYESIITSTEVEKMMDAMLWSFNLSHDCRVILKTLARDVVNLKMEAYIGADDIHRFRATPISGGCFFEYYIEKEKKFFPLGKAKEFLKGVVGRVVSIS